MPPTEYLDPDKIKAGLETKRIGKEIIVYKSTSSTNDIAAEYAKNPDNDGLAVFAEQQTKGRGRNGSTWQSPPAQSILCSILLTKDSPNAELLSLTAAVAVARTIDKPGQFPAKIKWPNDILIDNKKIAGILIESKTFNGRNASIIGIGINCRQKKSDFPTQLRSIATSIDLQSPSKCDRTLIAKRLLTELDHWLETAQAYPEKVVETWLTLSTQLNSRITLTYNGKNFIGRCIGIDPQKGLTLQLDSDLVKFFPAAHTTITKNH